MISLYDKYALKKNITERKLRAAGFINHKYRCYLFKDIIELQLYIQPEKNMMWMYEIVDDDYDEVYKAYYDRELGRNEVVKEVDRKLDKVFKTFIKYEIFECITNEE